VTNVPYPCNHAAERRSNGSASKAPASCVRMKPNTSADRMPAKVVANKPLPRAVVDMLRELQHRQIKHEVREPDAENGTHNACPAVLSARSAILR